MADALIFHKLEVNLPRAQIKRYRRGSVMELHRNIPNKIMLTEKNRCLRVITISDVPHYQTISKYLEEPKKLDFWHRKYRMWRIRYSKLPKRVKKEWRQTGMCRINKEEFKYAMGG